jgi:uncharacterized protein with ParB-like and HNH nuclease domain
MIKHVDHFPIYSIFDRESSIYYLIPKYQRAYTWGYNEWTALYDDLCENDEGYFIGSIIGINQGDSLSPYLEVIDGQQRLTTLSIFLAVLYHYLQTYRENLGEENEDILPSIRKSLRSEKSPNKFKLIPQIQDFNYDDYLAVMADAGFKVTTIKRPYYPLRKMNRCYRFFSERLQQELDKVNTNEAKMSVLLDRYNRVKTARLVKIEVETHSDAYVLFESLNNRGTPLTAIDLMKNLIMARAEKENLTTDECFDQWQVLLGYLSDDYKTQERFFRQYYNAFRTSLNQGFENDDKKRYPLGIVATKSNLLTIYEKLIKKDLSGFLHNIVEGGRLYSQIVFPMLETNQTVFTKSLQDLLHIQGAPSYLLLLYLFWHKDDLGISDQNLNSIIKLLIVFFVHRNLTDYPSTRDLTSIFMDVILKIENSEKNELSVYKIIHTVLSSFCEDVEFEKKLRGNLYKENVDAARFLLCSLSEHEMTLETYTNLWERTQSGVYRWTIEHIFPEGDNIPQSWVDMIADGDKSLANDYLQKYTHTIGNLTLTGYNSTLSNLPFDAKRDRKDKNGKYVGYKNGLSLNSKLAEKESWRIQDIEERTNELVAQLIILFKFPDN